ncbi:MAG: glycosyltransferase family 25 protein [Parachlamydiaceae bacterium]
MNNTIYLFSFFSFFCLLSISDSAFCLNQEPPSSLSIEAQINHRALSRDELLHQINHLIAQDQLEEARQLYRYFDCLLVDESVIQHSNELIEKLRRNGKQIIATTDPAREAKHNELIIVYGNYHHAHNNLPYCDKIWRHPLYFKELIHSQIEYDPAWESIGVIYILNLEERKDRYQEILSELCRMKAPLHRIHHYKVKKEVVSGVQFFDGLLSCTKNHRNIVADFLNGSYQTCLVLEDDVTFTADVEGNLKRLKTFFDRAYDYEVCLLNSSKNHEMKEYDDLLLLSYQECTTCSAYLLNRKGAEKVLVCFQEGYEKMIESRNACYACDLCWTKLQKNHKFFLFKTKFGYQRCNYSSISGQTNCHFD